MSPLGRQTPEAGKRVDQAGTQKSLNHTNYEGVPDTVRHASSVRHAGETIFRSARVMQLISNAWPAITGLLGDPYRSEEAPRQAF